MIAARAVQAASGVHATQLLICHAGASRAHLAAPFLVTLAYCMACLQWLSCASPTAGMTPAWWRHGHQEVSHEWMQAYNQHRGLITAAAVHSSVRHGYTARGATEHPSKHASPELDWQNSIQPLAHTHTGAIVSHLRHQQTLRWLSQMSHTSTSGLHTANTCITIHDLYGIQTSTLNGQQAYTDNSLARVELKHHSHR